MQSGMDMYFFFNTTAHNLLFEGWDITTKEGFVLSCFLFACSAIMFEILVGLSTYFTRLFTTNPLEMDWTSSINDRSPLLAPLQIPSSIQKVKQRKCRIHFARTIIHLISVALGYMVMLVVMTYNAHFLVSVVVGSTVGYFLFAPFRRPPKKKKAIDRRARRDSLTRSGRMDLGSDEPRLEVEGTEGSQNVNYYGAL